MDIVSWKLHYISLHNKHGCQTHIKWNQFILYGQCILNEINVLWVWWQKGSILVMHLGIWVFSCKGSFCLVDLKEGLFIKWFCVQGPQKVPPLPAFLFGKELTLSPISALLACLLFATNDGHICQIIVYFVVLIYSYIWHKRISTQSRYLEMEEMGQELIESCCSCIISPLSWKDLLCPESKNVGFNVYFASKLLGVGFLLYVVEVLACCLSIQHYI